MQSNNVAVSFYMWNGSDVSADCAILSDKKMQLRQKRGFAILDIRG